MLQGKENAKIQKKFLAEILKEYFKSGRIQSTAIAAKEDSAKAMLIFESCAGFVLPKDELFVTTSMGATDNHPVFYASQETLALEAEEKGIRCVLTGMLKVVVSMSGEENLTELRTEDGELVYMQEQYYKLFPYNTTFLLYQNAFYAFAPKTLNAWHGVVMRYRLQNEDF